MPEPDESPPAPPDAALPTEIRGLDPGELFARGMQTPRMSGEPGHGWTPPAVEEVAPLFPHYEILALLGHGGMGAVYQARQTSLDRLVAIKLLPLEISADRDFAGRFVREARAMARLSHPHIIAVHDSGQTAAGHLFFVMEFVEGANLHEVIRQTGLEPEQALALAGQVCAALAYAHEKGIVHRDIKPANVMLDTAGRAKVADFGLARLSEPGAELETTRTGTVMGTPDYMAPEQKRGAKVDHRADIYSLGVMLYEMLCRETPQGAFQPPSSRIGCNARIDRIVLRAMQQSPADRYQSTREMGAEVEAARALLRPGPVVSGKTPRPLFAALALAVVVVAAAAFFWAENAARKSAESVPSAPPAPVVQSQVFDLLALTDPAKDRVMPVGFGRANEWEKKGGVLRYESDGFSGKIVAPVEIEARSYEIEIAFARRGGVSQLNLDLPVTRGKIVPIALLARGLKIISGAAGDPWPDGLPEQGRITVRYDAEALGQPARVKVLFDGKPIAESSDVQRWQKNADPHPEFPGADMASLFAMRDSFEISAWTLRVLEGEARVLRPASR